MNQPTPMAIVVRYGRWVILAGLIFGFYKASSWMGTTPTKYERVNLNSPLPPSQQGLKKATMTPGRVVELITSRGEIDFVLFEKDCPKSTKRIADLATSGFYSKTRFTRVEKTGLIQVEDKKSSAKPMRREILEGLQNSKGAVGMARTDDPNSATSVFYILYEAWHHLDYEYTVFGRVIRGMDVITRIQKDDVIKAARVRPLTAEDKKLFYKALEIEAKRKTE